MTFEEATAILNQNPTGLFFGNINGRLITLRGPVMKGFLRPGDDIDMFREFK